MVNLKFWQNVVVRRPWEDKLRHVMRVSRKELRYFLRIHHIAEEMRVLVRKINEDVAATERVNKHSRSDKKDNVANEHLALLYEKEEGKLKRINTLLKRLKRFEGREQLVASVSKLEDSVNELFSEIRSKVGASHQALKNSIIAVQRGIRSITNRMKVFEGNILLETKEDLGTSVEAKNWEVAETTLCKILSNVAAFAQLDRELERHLRGVDQLLQRGQQAQRVRH